MTVAFEPADGRRARWRYCYDLVLTKEPGDEITYLEVMELLECDQLTALAAMRDAQRNLEMDRKHLLNNVPRFGWIVLNASGNLGQIEKARKKAYRATDRAARKIVATPREQLSQIERSRLDFETRHILGARDLYSRKSKTLAELEQESKRNEKPQLPFGKNEAS